ncbi:hypothetical protein PFISCL1PPCAC_5550, partial [Pristionchus fissidentatus]
TRSFFPHGLPSSKMISEFLLAFLLTSFLLVQCFGSKKKKVEATKTNSSKAAAPIGDSAKAVGTPTNAAAAPTGVKPAPEAKVTPPVATPPVKKEEEKKPEEKKEEEK